jgi:DNA-binding PadR family transcriptional regulator
MPDALTLEPQSLPRSCHEALILAVVADGSRHGYQLALEIEERSDGAFRFNHGTLYPILHRLEADGFIDGSWEESDSKRRRRLYVLTPRGRGHLGSLRKALEDFFDVLFGIIGRDEP